MKLRTLTYLLLSLVLTGCKGCSKSSQKYRSSQEDRASKRERRNQERDIVVTPELLIDKTIKVIPDNKKIKNDDDMKELFQSIEGDLMQTEGKVAKHLLALIVDLKEEGKLPRNATQVEQIISIKNHVYENWNYVHDPISDKDTWRSASNTLSLVHNGKYSGDCYDFAILTASFSRQIGLNSRFVAEIDKYDANSGHAWSEFLLPNGFNNNSLLHKQDVVKDDNGRWVSLDWFFGKDHFKYSEDYRVYDKL